ncbi:MAG: peptidoglycan-binding protein, partial [Fibrobacter sp.]|nr:peptidoglycan-binding protein [Fibrobacter sp.]
WLEVKTFGLDTALAHYHMNRSNYQGYNCFATYDAFAKAKKVSSQPKKGCLVVFRHSHIGRVLQVKEGRIYTNEGNTSALYGDRNGGTVRNKDYAITDGNILGYCLMDYEDNNSDSSFIEDLPIQSVGRVEAFQKWMNLWYTQVVREVCKDLLEEDNLYGRKTRNVALAVWKDVCNRKYQANLHPENPNFGSLCSQVAKKATIRKGDSGTFVAIAEGILAGKGYYQGNIDALFGSMLEEATKRFQKDQKIEGDGIIGSESWGRMFG